MKTVPPSSIASRGAGGNAGRPPSRRRRTIAARRQGRLTREPGGGALAQPGPAHVAAEGGDREGRRQVGVVGADHEVRVLVLGREQQRLARAGHAGGPLLERARREHVDVVLAEPAGVVAPRGGRGRSAGERQPGVGERERDRARVEHDGDLVGGVLEEVAQLVAQHLERGQHRGGLLGVPRLVAGGEGRGVGLDPGHGRDSRRRGRAPGDRAAESTSPAGRIRGAPLERALIGAEGARRERDADERRAPPARRCSRRASPQSSPEAAMRAASTAQLTGLTAAAVGDPARG